MRETDENSENVEPGEPVELDPRWGFEGAVRYSTRKPRDWGVLEPLVRQVLMRRAAGRRWDRLR